ncbi:response regulator transcription factor [Chitinophaga agri]|uniref:Response regulator transcription factor n=1 Tax=Chitinophaga agri TaxID=2703787 RepID=A0A6B9ZB60_9BACT|nr:response regulator transcription factor [Chitinophaga agri]QHS58345.1 response regulator transcription factor [Chitinophaga agri]
MKIAVGITDDHQLFLKSLSTLINTFSHFEVTLEALNGQELLNKLAASPSLPEIILIDVNMPVMNGIDTVHKIAAQYPLIRMIALSMKDDDTTIISMIKAGCNAYLQKDIHPDELEKALQQVYDKGIYNGDAFNINYRRLIRHDDQALKLTDKEMQFLQLACSDATYKKIAADMKVAERTVDGYREALFGKLNVQSRVGMVLEAIRRELVKL